MPTTSLSVINICNLALSRIRVLQRITQLTDNTPAGVACNAAYDFCRQDCLQQFPWGFASEYAALALQITGANEEWTYAYTYPADCLFIQRLTIAPTNQATLPVGTHPWPTFDRSDTNPAAIPFVKGYIQPVVSPPAAGYACVYTDLLNAWALYTFDQTDVTVFEPNFQNLLAWRLAKELALSLGSSDMIAGMAEKGYNDAKMKCAATAMNEQQNSQPYVTYNSEVIRGRWCG